MRKFITIPGFKGGQADSLYEGLEKQTFQTIRNLNVNRGNILSPLPAFVDITAPVGTGTNNFAPLNCIKGSDGLYYFVGNQTETSVRVRLYSTGSLIAAPTWTQRDTVTTTDALSSAMEEYKDGIFWGYGTTLKRWGDISGTPASTTISAGLTTGINFLRENKGLGVIFFVHDTGRLIGKYDNSTVTLAALTLNKDERAVGIEPWGRFNIIGIRQVAKQDKFYIWDGSATTVDDVIPTGDMGLQAFRLIGSVIHYIVARDVVQGDRFFRYYTLSIGGQPKLIKEFRVSTVTGTVDVEVQAMDTIGDTFQFAFGGDTYGLLDQVIWAYGSQNKDFPKMLWPYRTVLSGATTDIAFLSIKNFNDRFVVIYTDNALTRPYKIEAVGPSSTLSDDGIYESEAFPLNGGLPGQIMRIYMNHTPNPAGAGFTVSVKLIGNYPWDGTIPAEDTFTDLTTDRGSGGATGITQSTDNATFTEIASPANLEPARYAQIRVELDEISTTNGAEIIWPIILEIETELNRP